MNKTIQIRFLTSSGKAINISKIITLTFIDDWDKEFLNVSISCGIASGQ